MIVGIGAPYTRSYATYAACTLATKLSHLGATVWWPAVGGEQGIHTTWDHRVQRLKCRRERWRRLQKCDRVVWLGRIDHELQREPPTKHLAVVLPDHVDARTYRQWAHCERVLSPLYQTYQSLRTVYPSAYVCGWDSQMLLSSPRTSRSEFLSLLVVLDRRALRTRGWECLSLCQLLLEAIPEMRMTLAICGSAGRECRPLLTSLARHPQVEVKRHPGLAERQQMYLANDWALLLAMGDPLGHYAHEALAAHIPILALDSLPYSELITVREGRLLSCELLESDPLRLPITAWHTTTLLREITTHLLNPRLWRRLAGKEWECVGHARESFRSHWARLLELCEDGDGC